MTLTAEIAQAGLAAIHLKEIRIMGKVNKSAISGRFVKASTAKRHPSTTVTQSEGTKAKGNRSAKTGLFVTDATVRRHPKNTTTEGRG